MWDFWLPELRTFHLISCHTENKINNLGNHPEPSNGHI